MTTTMTMTVNMTIKRFLLLLAASVIGLSAYCHAAWTAVQIYTPPRTQCVLGTKVLTCTYTLSSPVGVGHALTFHFVTQQDSTTLPQQQLVSVYSCTSSPCTSGNNLESWVIDPFPCQGYAQGTEGSGSTDCAVVGYPGSVGGWTVLTFTRTNPANIGQTFGGDFIELSTNVGLWHLETAAGAQTTTGVFSATMTATTVTPGGNYAVLQAIVSDPTGVSGCGNVFISAHYGYCQNLNVSSTPTPVWTITPNYGAAGTAVVWGEGAVGTPPSGSVITNGNQLTSGVTAR